LGLKWTGKKNLRNIWFTILLQWIKDGSPKNDDKNNEDNDNEDVGDSDANKDWKCPFVQESIEEFFDDGGTGKAVIHEHTVFIIYLGVLFKIARRASTSRWGDNSILFEITL
jgi:hypothetical protein